MSINVLLADDHAVVRDGLKLLLEAQNIKVVGEASNGRDAVRLAIRLNPDIVLMDIAMPGLNGLEATREIHLECRSTQIIILSMFFSAEHVFRAFKAGARGYLLKESAGAEVVKAVHAVYRGSRYLSERISDHVVEDYVGDHRAADEKSPLARLSVREREVLQMVVEGKSSAEIARQLFLSSKTVETYRSRLMQKLGIGDIPALVKFAIQHGLTSL
jgi:DNA-binding NarL/FixJ family response regulator